MKNNHSLHISQSLLTLLPSLLHEYEYLLQKTAWELCAPCAGRINHLITLYKMLGVWSWHLRIHWVCLLHQILLNPAADADLYDNHNSHHRRYTVQLHISSTNSTQSDPVEQWFPYFLVWWMLQNNACLSYEQLNQSVTLLSQIVKL